MRSISRRSNKGGTQAPAGWSSQAVVRFSLISRRLPPASAPVLVRGRLLGVRLRCFGPDLTARTLFRQRRAGIACRGRHAWQCNVFDTAIKFNGSIMDRPSLVMRSAKATHSYSAKFPRTGHRSPLARASFCPVIRRRPRAMQPTRQPGGRPWSSWWGGNGSRRIGLPMRTRSITFSLR